MKKFFLIIILYAAFTFSAGIKEEVEKLIRKAFAAEITFQMEKYDLPAEVKNKIEVEVQQRFFKDFVYLYRIYSGNELKGYAVLDNVKGKAMPITFLVVFNKAGKIISTDIVKYREQYGGQVGNKNWNKQFEDKTADSGFEVGKDISSISGATISVNSVTKGVNKLSLLIEYLIKNK